MIIKTLSGKVIHGSGYGKKLGFPTANIDRRQYLRIGLNLPFGVYAGFVILPNGKRYRAGIVIGPLDAKKLPKLEAHIIDFTGNLYGKKIEVELHAYVRKFESYTTVPALQKQIHKDIITIKKLLKN